MGYVLKFIPFGTFNVNYRFTFFHFHPSIRPTFCIALDYLIIIIVCIPVVFYTTSIIKYLLIYPVKQCMQSALICCFDFILTMARNGREYEKEEEYELQDLENTLDASVNSQLSHIRRDWRSQDINVVFFPHFWNKVIIPPRNRYLSLCVILFDFSC